MKKERCGRTSQSKSGIDTAITARQNSAMFLPFFSLNPLSFRPVLLLSFFASLNQLCMHLPSIEVTRKRKTLAFICSNRSFSSLAAFLALIFPIRSYRSTTAHQQVNLFSSFSLVLELSLQNLGRLCLLVFYDPLSKCGSELGVLVGFSLCLPLFPCR